MGIAKFFGYLKSNYKKPQWLITKTKLNTNYNKENNITRSRLNMYTHVINKYLLYTNMDIYIVESSGYDFHKFNLIIKILKQRKFFNVTLLF